MATDLPAEREIAGRYRIVKSLGAGAAGEVFLADHIALGTPCVVKILHADHAGDEQQRERMRVEGQAQAKLVHANLVAVHDLGVLTDGRPYVAMEFVRGRSLAEELKLRGALPFREAIDVTRKVLAGLGAAHAIGVVHRDVKPANVLYGDPDNDQERAVKVLDWGIAKVVSNVDPRAPKPPKFPTAEGAILGTPSAMSPEQVRAQPVDARSDVYSTGVMLYKLVTGKGPFDGVKSQEAMLIAHVTEVPKPPSEATARPLPKGFDAVVLRALEKKPEDRYPSAESFSAALAELSNAPAQTHGTELMATVPLNNRTPGGTTEPLPPGPIVGPSAPRAAATLDARRAGPPEPLPVPLVAAPRRGSGRLVLVGAAILLTLVIAALALAALRAGVP